MEESQKKEETSEGTPVGFLLALLFFFVGLLWVSILLIWRLAVALVVGVLVLVRRVLIFRIFVVVMLLLMVAGVFVQEFQPELMETSDVVWECEISPTQQVFWSFLRFTVRTVADFGLPRYNDVLLFFRDCLQDFIDDMIVLFETFEISDISELISGILQQFIVCPLCIWTDIPSLEIPIATEIFRVIKGWLTCIVDLIDTLQSLVLAVKVFNEDCYYCDLDPDQTCTLRKDIPGFAPADCSECHDVIGDLIRCLIPLPLAPPFSWLPDIVGLIGDLIEDLEPEVSEILNDIADAIDDVLDSLACYINSLFKPPFWMLQGLLDGCLDLDDILNTDPNHNGSILQWFVGTDPIKGFMVCLFEMIDAVTGGNLEEWLLILLGSLWDFVADLVRSWDNIVLCFSDPVFNECLEEYPDAGPGECDASEIPVPSGIFQCFDRVTNCLDNSTAIPLLVPIGSEGIDLLALIPVIFQSTVDFLVCPFEDFIDCFPAPDCDPDLEISELDDLFCVFDCMADIALFAPLADIVLDFIEGLDAVISAIVEAIEDILAVFDCFAGECVREAGEDIIPGPDECGLFEAIACIFGCFEDTSSCDNTEDRKRGIRTSNYLPYGNYTVETMEDTGRELWQDYLRRQGLLEDTMCGQLLYRYAPYSFVLKKDPATGMLWKACLEQYVMVQVQTREKKKKQTSEMGGFMADVVNRLSLWYLDSKKHDVRFSSVGMGSVTKRAVKMAIGELSDNVLDSARPWLQKKGEQLRSLRGNGVVLMMRDQAIRFKTWVESTPLFKTTKEYIRRKERMEQEVYQIVKRSEDPLDGAILQQQHEAAQEMLYAGYMQAVLTMYRQKGLITDPSEETPMPALPAGQGNSSELSGSPSDREVAFVLEPRTASSGRILPIIRSRATIRKKAIKAVNTIIKGTEELHTSGKMAKVIVQNVGHFAPKRLARLAVATEVIATRNISFFFKWMKGDTDYVPGEGFLSKRNTEEMFRDRSLNEAPKGLLLLGSEQDASVHDGVFTPFLFSRKTNENSPSKGPNLVEHFQRSRIKYDAYRVHWAPGQKAALLDHGPNLNSWFFSLFPALEAFLEDWLLSGQDTDFDKEAEDFLDRLFDEFFVCMVPENLDGTLQYSPFCFPLLPEDLFTWIETVPDNKLAPIQIPWAQELIIKNCTNIFNGNDCFFFNFTLSDNCGANDGQERPLCPLCDHCPREYISCKAAGIIDFMDSLFIFLSVIPGFLEDALLGGFDPIDLQHFLAIGTFLYFLLNGAWISAFFFFWFQYLQLWIGKFLFGPIIPWGWLTVWLLIIFFKIFSRFTGASLALFIFSFVTFVIDLVFPVLDGIIEENVRPLDWAIRILCFAQNSPLFSNIFFSIAVSIALFVALLALLLAFTAARTWKGNTATTITFVLLILGVVAVLVFGFLVFDSLSPLPGVFPTLEQLKQRAKDFEIPVGESISDVNWQCFFIRFDSLAIFALLLFFSFQFFGAFLVRIGGAITLFFFGIWAVFVLLRARIRQWKIRRETYTNEDNIGLIKAEVNKHIEVFKETTKQTIKQEIESFIRLIGDVTGKDISIIIEPPKPLLPTRMTAASRRTSTAKKD